MGRPKSSDKICITFFKKIQSNAVKRNLEFNLDIDYLYDLYLNQNKKCALTGVDINIVNSTVRLNYKLNTASLDRIDNNKGYTKDNVRWIHKNLNQIKSDYSDEELIFICHLVSKNNPKFNSHLNIDEIRKPIKRINNSIDKMKHANPNKKPVLQFDLNMNFIREFESINEAVRILELKSPFGIIGCCKNKQKSSMGFIWRYKNN